MSGKSGKRKRSRSRSDEGSRITKMLKRIEQRLASVENKQLVLSRRRRGKFPRSSSSGSESETERGRNSRSRRRDDTSWHDRNSPRTPRSRSLSRHTRTPSESHEEEELGETEGDRTVAPDNNAPHDDLFRHMGNQERESEDNPPELQEELLSILGKDKTNKKLFANPIQKDVASRWSFILSSGLEEETRNELMGKYLPPENCPLLKPPDINPEVKVAISESVLRRDTRLSHLQGQLGASLSAIGLALTNLLQNDNLNSKENIQLLSDASRLLANTFHSESISRRELLALNLNNELKETLVNTPVNELLFGNDLDNRIKAVQELEKSGKQLKNQKRPSKNSSLAARKASTSKVQGNYKSPFFQKYGARKSGQTSRAPLHNSQRRSFQNQKRRMDNPRSDRQHRFQY